MVHKVEASNLKQLQYWQRLY